MERAIYSALRDARGRWRHQGRDVRHGAARIICIVNRPNVPR
jgi:hypothetical protein